MSRVSTSVNNDEQDHASRLPEQSVVPMTLTVRPCLYTTKIVRGLFGASIGLVLDSFSCSFNRYTGRVYITSKAICFFSQMFGFEKKFVLWIIDTLTVSNIRKTSILVRVRREPPRVHHDRCNMDDDNDEDDGSSSSHYKFFMDDAEDADGNRSSEGEEAPVITPTQDCLLSSHNSSYIFRKVQDRDKVLYLLRLLMSRLKGGANHVVEQQQRHQSHDLTRKSKLDIDTNHHHLSHDTSCYEPIKDCETSNLTPIVSTPNTTSTLQKSTTHRPTHRHRRITRSRSVTPYRHISFVPNSRSSFSTLDMMQGKKFPLPSRQRVWSEWSPEHYDEVSDNIMDADAMLLFRNSTSSIDMTPTPTPSTNMTDENDVHRHWMEKKQLFSTLELEAIPSHTIPYCSIQDFFSWFLSDTAQYPMHQFLTQVIGDRNVHTTIWSDVSPPQQHFFEKTRQLTLDHRISSSIGPSHAATTRTQTCTCYGTTLCIQEKTQISGAPAADCFYVETIWILESCSKESFGSHYNELSIQVRFQIHFVKGTLLKSIIASMTRSETQHWFQSYVTMVRDSCLEQEQRRKDNASDMTALNMNANQNNVPGLLPLLQDYNAHQSYTDKAHGSSNRWVWMLISILSFLLLSCLWMIYSIFTKITLLEKELQRLQRRLDL